MYFRVRNLAGPTAALLSALILPATPARGQNGQEARLVAVNHPITSNVVQVITSQVTAGRNNEVRRLTTIVFDFTPDGKDANSTDAQFGECLNLAQFIHGLKGQVDTIAFVHGKVSGHSVLPVLACEHLVMSKDARIGEVVTEGVAPLGKTQRTAYEATFGHPVSQFAIVQKMFDRDVQLRKGKYKQGGQVYFVDGRDAAKVALVSDLAPVPGAQAGQYGLFTGLQAVELGLCEVLAESTQELAEAYGLPPLRPLIAYDKQPVAYRYTITGEVTGAVRESFKSMLRNIKAEKGNTLILTLDCGGGDLNAAKDLAYDLIAAQTGEDPIKIVAFIPNKAPDTATFIALACSEIVMSRRKDAIDPQHPEETREAEIGDFEVVVNSLKGEADAFRTALRDIAEKQGYPGILVDGMFDRNLEIVRAHNAKNKDHRKLMSRTELDASKGEWIDDGTVKPKGQLLTLNATKAAEVGLARFVVDNRDVKEVYALYGVDPTTVRELTPGWLDQFAAYVRREWVTVLLVVIGFTGLLLELKMPGLTIPGIIAALCFILVFWAHSRIAGQTAIALAILLFLLGLVLVGLELFVLPGFGVCGIVGVGCMLAGLALVAFDKVPALNDGAAWERFGMKVSQYLLGMIGAFSLAFLIARFLPKVPYANRLLLAPPTDKPDSPEAVLPGASEAAGLLGAIGTTNTTLRPAGVVRFADKFVDVVSDGGFVPAGTRVQVIEVEGTRIVVKEV